MVAIRVLHAIRNFLRCQAVGSEISAFHGARELASRHGGRRSSCGGEHSGAYRKRDGSLKASLRTSARGALTDVDHAVNAASDIEVRSLLLAAAVWIGIRTADRANSSSGLS